jgi:serine phosphatase RsbU (regulator of sigma subunit)
VDSKGIGGSWESLADELGNFHEIARHLKPSPGEIPRLLGVEIAGLSLPLKDAMIGGDHVIYIDFNRRYDLEARIADATKKGREDVVRNLQGLRSRAGILVADVAGHRMTDALIAAMLHQAFLLGAIYELDLFGQITTRLFEHINTRFYRTTAFNKYFTMIYGEILDEGRFRFISAGHPPPAVFSREFGRFMKISEDRLVSFPPVGMLPSSSDPDDRVSPSHFQYKRRYEVNEINLLSVGDILLLHTDGLSEHDGGRFFPGRVEERLSESGNRGAEDICEALRAEIRAGAPQTDDITIVVIRKKS